MISAVRLRTQPGLSLVLVSLVLSALAPSARADGALPSLKATLETAKRKEKVLLTGKVVIARTLDLFILSDGSADVLVNAANVRTTIAVGENLVIWGRFIGFSERFPAFKEVEVLEVAAVGSPQAAAMISAHPVAAASPSPVASGVSTPVPMTTPAAPARTTESRLRELDDLKAKKLVTDAEYQDQRKRILSGL